MIRPPETLAEEFDAIARALEANPRRDELTASERALLGHLPLSAKRGLDVGCGDGILTREAAARGIIMLGIDLSPTMIALAREKTAGMDRATFKVADVMTDDIPGQPFDAVMTVNMVHHLPLEVVLPRLARLVAPGGTLLIQDVVSRPGVRYLPVNVLAAVHRRTKALLRPTRNAKPVAALYDAHGEGEVYLEPHRVRGAYDALLPGAVVLHHLEWRYSVVWRRPLR